MEKSNKKNNQKIISSKERFCIAREFLPVFLISIFLIIFVLGAVYVTYLFIHVSKVSDVADLHLTDKIELAKRTALREAYSNPEEGIYNWHKYEDRVNGFVIKYPEDWDLYVGQYAFEIRKYNSKKSSEESLASRFFIEQLENPKGLVMKDFAANYTGEKADNFHEFILSGSNAVKLKKETSESGFISTCLFWKKGEKIYHLKGLYFNSSSKDLENLFDKIVSEIEII